MKIISYPNIKPFIIYRVAVLLFIALLAVIPQVVSAQCTLNSVPYYSTHTAPVADTNFVFGNCGLLDTRYEIVSVDSNSTYVVSFDGPLTDVVTICDSNQVVITYGASPLFFVAPYSGTYNVQANSLFCGGAFQCSVFSITNLGVVTCEQPAMLLANNITPSSAVLGWSEM
jgi:hypothetical protein